MKLIIDIPDYNLSDIQNGSIACGQILKAVKNGKPYKEKPQGKWVVGERNGEGYDYYCSRCMQITLEDINRINFCPKCGAEMER